MKLSKYIFLDNSEYPPSKEIYTCETTDIEAAIILFEENTNISFKKKYISVKIQ